MGSLQAEIACLREARLGALKKIQDIYLQKKVLEVIVVQIRPAPSSPLLGTPISTPHPFSVFLPALVPFLFLTLSQAAA